LAKNRTEAGNPGVFLSFFPLTAGFLFLFNKVGCSLLELIVRRGGVRTTGNGIAGFALAAVCLAAGGAALAAEGDVDSAAILAAHNQWRAKTGVPDLVWSDKLAAAAQKWASHLAGTTCTHGHSGGEHGENLYWASPRIGSDRRHSPQNVTPQKVVDAWGSEIKDYDYSDNSCHTICGHYTQLVWRDTKEVGCAMAVCPDKAQIWVCNYHPAGNMIGKKPY
jgi:pathogenesis-related protein 1